MASNATTAPTPMMMPSIVSAVRITFAAKLCREEGRLSERGTPPPPRDCGGMLSTASCAVGSSRCSALLPGTATILCAMHLLLCGITKCGRNRISYFRSRRGSRQRDVNYLRRVPPLLPALPPPGEYLPLPLRGQASAAIGIGGQRRVPGQRVAHRLGDRAESEPRRVCLVAARAINPRHARRQPERQFHPRAYTLRAQELLVHPDEPRVAPARRLALFQYPAQH